MLMFKDCWNLSGVLYTNFDVYDMMGLIYEKATLFCVKALFVASACYHTLFTEPETGSFVRNDGF